MNVLKNLQESENKLKGMYKRNKNLTLYLTRIYAIHWNKHIQPRKQGKTICKQGIPSEKKQ